MNYTRAIFFKDGKTLTITDQEYQGIFKALAERVEWIEVQGNLISKDTIARLGNHEATAQMKKTQEANLERKLILEGQSDLVDMRRKLIEKKSIEHCQKEEFPVLLENPEEDYGSSMFYLDKKTGEKMYS